jgi:hypothetical protein
MFHSAAVLYVMFLSLLILVFLLFVIVGSRPKWGRKRAQRKMIDGREIVGNKECMRKETIGKKHSTCTCKKAATYGRKKHTHAEKEDLTTIVVRVFVGFL